MTTLVEDEELKRLRAMSEGSKPFKASPLWERGGVERLAESLKGGGNAGARCMREGRRVRAVIGVRGSFLSSDSVESVAEEERAERA